ncbi:MAG: hypothetical protein ACYCV4_18335 [Dermatophilaceae bacterium]
MDDDLIVLGEDHPEASEYAPLGGGIRRLLAEVDVVWASTSLLAERLEQYASTVPGGPHLGSGARGGGTSEGPASPACWTPTTKALHSQRRTNGE